MHFLLRALCNLTLLCKILTRSVFQLSQSSMEDNPLYFQTMKCLPVFQLHALPLLVFKSVQSDRNTVQPISEANINENQPEYSILALSK